MNQFITRAQQAIDEFNRSTAHERTGDPDLTHVVDCELIDADYTDGKNAVNYLMVIQSECGIEETVIARKSGAELLMDDE